MKNLFLIIAVLSMLSACNSTGKKASENKTQYNAQTDYAVLMGETVLKNYPDLWSIEDRTNPKWTYTYGLVCFAIEKLYQQTKDERFLDYAKAYPDALIDEHGKINTYCKTDYNIDKLNSGRILFSLYEANKDPRYKTAMDTLRSQLYKHPQTKMGGFWHKKRYPHQMWLDGVYMGAPFYTQYAVTFNECDALDEIALWVKNVHQVTFDKKTGLLYHGWDESKEQAWANKETGCSPNFWGRGMGWYAMALVDVLDYFPKDHAEYQAILDIVNSTAATIVKYQDEESGVWYQVLDQGKRDGNYLEGSVSSMFSYFLLKAINKGYIANDVYQAKAVKAYEGIVNHLMKINEDKTLVLTPVCAVAGLGGNPYRDGTYEYYINENLRDNDPKAVGPFILAGLEFNQLKK